MNPDPSSMAAVAAAIVGPPQLLAVDGKLVIVEAAAMPSSPMAWLKE